MRYSVDPRQQALFDPAENMFSPMTIKFLGSGDTILIFVWSALSSPLCAWTRAWGRSLSAIWGHHTHFEERATCKTPHRAMVWPVD